MFQQLLTIARNTFIESIRQPIFSVLILVGALAMVLNQQLAAYTFTDDNKMLIDMGLSTIFLIGLLLAAFSATGVLVSEIENRTVLTVVSKPVSRPIFVLGKYVGVAVAIAVAYTVLSIFLYYAIRHRVMTRASDHIDQPVLLFSVGALVLAMGLAAAGNFLFRWVFTSTFVLWLWVTQVVGFLLVLVIDKKWQIQSPLTDLLAHDGRLLQVGSGLVLIFEAVMILTAIAIAASTRLGQIMTLVFCIGVFFLGLVSNSLSAWVNLKVGVETQSGSFAFFGTIFATEMPLHQQIAYAVMQVIYLLAPNLQFFWPADAITQGQPYTAAHWVLVSAYAMLYIAVMLAAAVALFQGREVS